MVCVVWCRGVWCETLKNHCVQIQNASVCTFKTFPCIPAPHPHPATIHQSPPHGNHVACCRRHQFRGSGSRRGEGGGGGREGRGREVVVVESFRVQSGQSVMHANWKQHQINDDPQAHHVLNRNFVDQMLIEISTCSATWLI